LKADIKEKLEKRTEASAKQTLRRKLIDELLKKNSFDLPGSMISNYLDMLVEGAKNNGNAQQIDEDELRKNYEPSAIWNLKWELAKDKLREMLEVSITEDDKKAFIARISEERGIPETEIKKSIKGKENKARFEEDLEEQKILDHLEENAKIKEKKITRKDLEKAKRMAA